MWPIILSIIALGIIAGVSFYAFKLLRKLREQNTLIKQAKIARTKRLKESMVIIAKAMQNGDCNHSEGVIRLSMLLLPFGQPYQAMYALYNIVKEMPTHEARKALLKKERMKLDLERESAEAKFEEEIMLELRQFLNDVEKFGEA
jgi:hypothetical protein